MTAGKTCGQDIDELFIHGQWIADEYDRDEEKSADTFQEEWLCTKDVVTINKEGNVEIVTRTKDLIKNGGYVFLLWNWKMRSWAIREFSKQQSFHADPKWEEYPVACVVLHENAELSKEEILSYLESKFIKSRVQDDVIFMEELPKTSVDKLLKRTLRDHVWELYTEKK